MNDKQNHDQVKEANVGRTLSLLWGMYLVSSCIFVAIGYLIIHGKLVAVDIDPVRLVGIAITGMVLGEIAVRLAIRATSIPDARNRLLFSLIALSIVELVAIGGIVISRLFESPQPLILLSAIALLMFYRLAGILR